MANGTNWAGKKNDYYKQWRAKKKQAKSAPAPAQTVAPTNFKDPHAAHAFFGDNQPGSMYQSWKSNLSNWQTESVKDYTGSDYRAMNGVLRGTISTDNADVGTFMQIGGVTTAIQQFDLKSPIIVYRGTSHKIFGGKFTVDQFNQMKGCTITDNGFGSSAADKAHSWKHKGYIMKITVPQGKGRGAWVDPMSLHKGEQEFIIQRGSQYRIDGA